MYHILIKSANPPKNSGFGWKWAVINTNPHTLPAMFPKLFSELIYNTSAFFLSFIVKKEQVWVN